MRIMVSSLLLVVGIVLLILGLSASDSAASGFSRFFRGTPTDRATLLLLFGAGLSVMGLTGIALTFRGRPLQ